MKNFNLEDLLETHFEIATRLEQMTELDYEQQPEKFAERYLNYGRGGLYLISQKLSLEFEKKYKDVNWGEDLDWVETIEEFLNEKL
jgi:hypothetical protein